MPDSDTAFDFKPAYKVAGHGGVAWRVTAFVTEDRQVETEYDPRIDGIDEDPYIEVDYEEVIDESRVVAHMIGDDSDWTFDVTDLTPLADDEYCSSCGQVGCGWH